MNVDLYHYSTWGNGPRLDQLAEVDAEDGPCIGGDCENSGWHVLIIQVPRGLTRDQAIAWAIDGGLASQP